METRSRTTKLIVKNVETLENQKYDKFDKVVQWLNTLQYDLYQHRKSFQMEASMNQQNELITQIDKSGILLDSDSSVNTARYILSNRKNKRKSSTQCRSKIKKYRENDVQFDYGDSEEFNASGHKMKRLKIEDIPNVKYCSVAIQKINAKEINFDGT